jgi:hypothetical protein
MHIYIFWWWCRRRRSVPFAFAPAPGNNAQFILTTALSPAAASTPCTRTTFFVSLCVHLAGVFLAPVCECVFCQTHAFQFSDNRLISAIASFYGTCVCVCSLVERFTQVYCVCPALSCYILLCGAHRVERRTIQ